MHYMKQFFGSSTGRVTASYLALIMAMSISFSAVFYQTSARELTRPAPPNGTMRNTPLNPTHLDDFLHERAAEGRQRLLTNLILLNMLTLIAGSFISYTLARKTLEPIEQAMETQTRFASDASHELRTPLAAIQAENEVALRKSNLTLTRAKELLRSNLEEINKLGLLADGLLQLTRTENIVVDFRPVALRDVTAAAINRVIQQAQAKHITIKDTTARLSVRGDEQLITQVIVILLDNAIKYSPERTVIHLDIAAEGKRAIIRIRDEGPGIAESDQTHIFERFYRADPSRSNQHTPGHGLGLSIASKIISLHRGTITVESAPLAGSTFLISLPL